MPYRRCARIQCRLPSIAVLVFVIFFPVADASADPNYATLELLLAVDCSSGVSDEEFDLQMQGIALAFEHPSILAAIEQSGSSGIAVSLVQWSSLNDQAVALDWTHIRGIGDALAFARGVRSVGRLIGGGSTSLSAVMSKAVGSIESNGIEGERRVIDVSGDGRANEGQSPAHARVYANQAGITINGLAILNEEPDLASYYLAWVVGGPGSFLLTADNYHDFVEAIRRKLHMEIIGPPIAGVPDILELWTKYHHSAPLTAFEVQTSDAAENRPLTLVDLSSLSMRYDTKEASNLADIPIKRSRSRHCLRCRELLHW